MTIESRDELFAGRPAPWSVDKFQRDYAAVIDANGATVLTVNGVALAEFIAAAANAFAADEFVFIAANNNAEKIAVLTVQRDEAQRLCKKLRIAQTLMTQNWLTLSEHYDASPRTQGEAEMLKLCAGELARTFNAVLAGSAPAKE